jgi:hypothetical protein
VNTGLDFNSAKTQDEYSPQSAMPDIDEVKGRLQGQIRHALAYLLPAGVFRHGKFYVGDIYGNKGDSLVVEIAGQKAGMWHDFATGDGGDIISLWGAVHGLDSRTDFLEIIAQIADWLGVSRMQSKRETDLGAPTARWDYQDASGNLIACVYRYDTGDGKEFRPWDVKARRHKAPEPRPLYNQPGIATVSHVVLVEGEKCADALIARGICATTAMNGANAPVEKTDWSPLQGKQIVIWPDNDEAGREYAARVVDVLPYHKVRSIALLTPPPDKPLKWDAANALTDGTDIDALIASATIIPIERRSPIAAYDVGTLLDDASDVPPDLIAPRILTHGGLGVLGGAPKVGKSDLLICWMAHMAAGLPFLGMTPPRPLKIFYFQLEIGYHYLRERLRALSFDETAWPLVRKNLVITPQVNCLLNEQGVSKLRDTILCFFEPGEVDVIVIDPLRNVFDSSKGANENDNTAMLQFLQERVECLRQMVNPMAGVILAHHIRKIQKKQLEEDPFQALSGAGAIRSFYSSGIVLYRPDEQQSIRRLCFELRNGETPPVKHIDKINGEWCEVDVESERLVNKHYGERLDAERRRKHDQILEIIFDEGRKGNLYTASLFTQVWENKAGLGGRHAIRDRIDVLTSKGFIKFNKDGAARSRNGFLCVEGMEIPGGTEQIDTDTGEVTTPYKPFLPTHYRSPSDGAVLPIEDPDVWIYHDEVTV